MLTFSEALQALKQGQMVARRGWRRQHVYLEEHVAFKIRAGAYAGSVRHYPPCFVLFTQPNQHQCGWLPTIGDLLAIDWRVVRS